MLAILNRTLPVENPFKAATLKSMAISHVYESTNKSRKERTQLHDYQQVILSKSLSAQNITI